MKRSTAAARNDRFSDEQDGELIFPGPDAPRLCAGRLRVVGVRRIDARNLWALRELAADLRAQGLVRSTDGVLEAGQFDLVLSGSTYAALYIPGVLS